MLLRYRTTARRDLVWLHGKDLPGSGHGCPKHSSPGSRARWHCVSKKLLCIISLKKWRFCFFFLFYLLSVRQNIPSPCKVNPNKSGLNCFQIWLFVCTFSHCCTDPRELFLYDLGYMTLKIKNVGIMYISFPIQNWQHYNVLVFFFFLKKRNKQRTRSLVWCDDLYAD